MIARPLITMRMHQPEAVMLSYLVGLGRVGEPIEIGLKELLSDLGLVHRAYFYRLLNRLIGLHAVRRIACGSGQTTGLLMVLKRPEQAFPIKPKERWERIPETAARPPHWRSQQRWAELQASLNPELRNRQIAGARLGGAGPSRDLHLVGVQT